MRRFRRTVRSSMLPRRRNVSDLPNQLVWVDRKGAATPITPKRGGFSEPQLSPDGKQLLVCIEDKQERSDVWLCDLGSDAWTRLTSEGDHFAPRWSPDGKQIAFSSNRNGPYDVFLMPSDASAPARQLTRNQAWTWGDFVVSDGKTLLASWQRPVTGVDVMTVPISEPDQRRPFHRHHRRWKRGIVFARRTMDRVSIQ